MGKYPAFSVRPRREAATLNMLMGLIYHDQGLAGCSGGSGRSADQGQLGFLPESPYFYDYLTSREFLGFYGHLFGLWGAVLDKRIDELLELVLV